MYLKKSHKHFLIIFLCGASIMAKPISDAQAQSLDYNGLEALFGEPVTTSANGSPQKLSDVPLNMEIITAEDLERSGARTIPEALRFLPGLNVRQKTFGQTEVSIRGYNQNNAERILVLVNGRQVYTDFFGQVVWDNIPVEISEIKQIEVVKGPNTALFGFNAVSGVINIITVNPLYDEAIQLKTSVGSHEFSEVSGVFSHKITEKLGFKFSGGAYRANEPFQFASTDVQDDVTRGSGTIDIWAQLTDRIQAQLELTKNRHDRNEYVIASTIPSHIEYDTSSIRGRILSDTRWGLWEFDVYHNATDADFQLTVNSAVSEISADNRVTVAKLNNTFGVGTDHIIRLGGEYRTASNIFTPADGDDLTYDIMSGSVLWDWRTNERLRTSAAIRFDSFELKPDSSGNVSPLFPAGATPFVNNDFHQSLNEFSYNFGAVYNLTNQDNFRASISRGADLPSFTEFGLQFLSTPSAINPSGIAALGDPNVDTAIIHNVELGYDHDIEAIDGLFRSAVFYQYNEDLQGFAARVSTIPNFFGLGSNLDQAFLGNIGDSEMFGFELGLEGKYQDHWNWMANYTYVNINDDLRNQLNSFPFSSTAEYQDSNIEHILNAHLGYTADKWNAGLYGQYTSSEKSLMVIPNSNTGLSQFEVEDQFIVNANFSYSLTDQIKWAISGTSLLGDTQQSSQTDSETSLWTSVKFTF